MLRLMRTREENVLSATMRDMQRDVVVRGQKEGGSAEWLLKTHSIPGSAIPALHGLSNSTPLATL